MFRLDDKLARIRSGAYRRSDFIIADAKDPDMGPGLHAVGPARATHGATPRLSTRAEFLDSIEAIVKQDIVDIMLTSVFQLGKARQAQRFRRHGGQARHPRQRHDRRLAPSRRGFIILSRRGRSAPHRFHT